MPSVCVDANFPLAMLLNEPYRASVEALWDGWTTGGTSIFTAPLFYAEVTSVLRERAYRGETTDEGARARLQDALAWNVVVWEESPDLQRTAYEFAARFDRPKAYDAQYLAVAALAGCDLWTVDERLYNAVHAQLPWVRYIGESQ